MSFIRPFPSFRVGPRLYLLSIPKGERRMLTALSGALDSIPAVFARQWIPRLLPHFRLPRWGVLLIIRRFISSPFFPFSPTLFARLFSYHKNAGRCAFWSIVCRRFDSITWPLFLLSQLIRMKSSRQIFEGVFFLYVSSLNKNKTFKYFEMII